MERKNDIIVYNWLHFIKVYFYITETYKTTKNYEKNSNNIYYYPYNVFSY